MPGCGKHAVCSDDVPLVVDSASFTMSWLAEFLPAQTVCNDAKQLLPSGATALAVRKVGNETEYLGSFDLLLRLHSTKSATWKDYNECEVALDVKLTGAEHLGLSGVTLKQ